jgi:hypothetical protein
MTVTFPASDTIGESIPVVDTIEKHAGGGGLHFP